MTASSLLYILLALLTLGGAVVRAVFARKKILHGTFERAGHFEVFFLVVLLAALIVLGCLQIVLRNLFHTGILWAEPLMRHLVLWIGCLGASLATSRLRHINIDVFSRLLPDVLKPVRRAVVYTATATAAFVLGIAALRLVLDERAFGEKAFLGLDTWVLQSVLPLTFFLIAYRSLFNLFAGRETAVVGLADESMEQQ